MKHASVITSVLSKVEVPNNDLEDIVNHRQRTAKYRLPIFGANQASFSPDFEIIQTLTSEITAKGNLQIFYSEYRSKSVFKLEVPMRSSFLVTCIKGKDCRFRAAVSISLT